MLRVVLALAGLLLPSDARKQEKLEVRFGFAESVQISGASTERFRLEMVLSAQAQSESDKMEEKFYERLKSVYGARGSGADEKPLTASQFHSLASERLGDLYTLVTPEGVVQGTVRGGVIAIDPHYNDVEQPLFRLYLELSVPGSRAPGNGRSCRHRNQRAAPRGPLERVSEERARGRHTSAGGALPTDPGSSP